MVKPMHTPYTSNKRVSRRLKNDTFNRERKSNKVLQLPLNALRIAAVMKILKTLLNTSASKITDKDPD